nr:reverse transcriptase domain-containing protein [Tanacetum cinerariifolium]
MTFIVIRSPSPYNGIIGRPGISAIRAVPSTAHGMLKFPVDGGIVTIYNTTVPPKECNTVACDATQTQTQHAAKVINLKVAIHHDYPEQEVSIGGRCLTEAGRRCATYQRLVDSAFEWQVGRNLEVYVNDLVIKSHTEDELVRDIEETFRTLQKINMKLNPKKCTFVATKGMFLGYLIEFDGIKPCPEKQRLVVLLTDRNSVQTPVYFVSKALKKTEVNYSAMEKLVLVLVFAAKRLRRYFQAHPIVADYVLREIHVGSCSMHSGPRSVVARALRSGYYWPTMHRDARDVINKCSDCQVYRPIPRQPQQQLTPITSLWPFYKWGIDIAGPFPVAAGGLKFLIVAIDYFTKWIEAKAVATISISGPRRQSNDQSSNHNKADAIYMVQSWQRKTRQKSSNHNNSYRNQRGVWGNDKYTPLTKTPKEILATVGANFLKPPPMRTREEQRVRNGGKKDTHKDKADTIYMVQSWQRKTRQKGRKVQRKFSHREAACIFAKVRTKRAI